MRFEHVFNTAGATDGTNPPDKLTSKGHQIERNVDRFGLGLNAKHPARRIEFSLIHHDILAHPPVTMAS